MKRLVLPALAAVLLSAQPAANAGFSIGCSERPGPSRQYGRTPAGQGAVPFAPPAPYGARDAEGSNRGGAEPATPPARKAWVDELYRRFPNVAGAGRERPPGYPATPGR